MVIWIFGYVYPATSNTKFIARLLAINCLYEDNSIFKNYPNYLNLFCGMRKKGTNIDLFVVTY